LVVVYAFVDSHKDMNINKFRIPTTKHFFKVVNFVIYDGECREAGYENNEVGRSQPAIA